MKITKREKIERYESVQHASLKNELAMHDLVNGKFGKHINVFPKDIGIDDSGYWRMRLSPRGMPLYLICFIHGGQDQQVRVFDDNEIQDLFRDNPLGTYARVLMTGRNRLMDAWLKSQRTTEVAQ